MKEKNSQYSLKGMNKKFKSFKSGQIYYGTNKLQISPKFSEYLDYEIMYKLHYKTCT